MHKMFHSSKKLIGRRFDRIMLWAALPAAAAALILVVISLMIRYSGGGVPDKLYVTIFAALYCTAAYAFVVSLIYGIIAGRKLEGHEKYSYIEILGQDMVVSEYTGSARIDGELMHYRRLWVMNLSDVEQVTCTRTRFKISGRARKFEQRADRLDYVSDDFGHIDFDNWQLNSGGEEVTRIDIRDNYFYAESIARRIIYCSEKQKQREIRRAEFRQRMLEIARSGRKTRKKPKERVFRGYEIERNF